MVKDVKKLRLQSAMEYLMTYGWAILIIAVVLAVLFALGIFGNPLGSTCVASPGFLCQNWVMNSTTKNAGMLSFTSGQNTGSTKYNIGFACSATTTVNGEPYTTGENPWRFPAEGLAGTANGISIAGNTEDVAGVITDPLTLVSGQTTYVGIVLCFTSQGAEIPNTIGTVFDGTVFINYTTAPGTVNSANPWQTTKFATVSIKVT